MSIDTTALHTRTQDLLSRVSHTPYTSEQAALLVADLVSVVTQHNVLYYTAQPIIADIQYDTLFSFLLRIEELFPDVVLPESPTQKLRVEIAPWFMKKSHSPYRLLSLKNSYNAEDIEQWWTQIGKLLPEEDTNILCTIEPKFDGSSVHIVYEHGHLVAGITRGDGERGEDITQNIHMIQNLPVYLASIAHIPSLHLRWEVLMHTRIFEDINKWQLAQWLPVFANERNAASGTLRQLDPHIVRSRWLVLFVHEVLGSEWYVFPGSDAAMKQQLSDRWLPLFPRSKQCTTCKELIDICTDEVSKKALYAYPFLFDGLVIKVDTYRQREVIGATDHHPKWAIAYKYPAEQITTRLLSITYQVGRTWAITPVAELEPVVLSGALLSRASLHNADYIAEHDIRVGDHVRIQRSGEVIPYVLGPVQDLRDGTQEEVVFPDICPTCSTPLIRNDGEVAMLCPNRSGCPAQRKEQIKHAVSKQCLDISGFGSALVEQCVDADLLDSRADVWTITTDEKLPHFRALPGIADKKVAQLRGELAKAKQAPLWRILHALGIPFVGKKMARVLEEHIAKYVTEEFTFADMQQVCTARETLESIHWLGPQTIDALIVYMTDTSWHAPLEQAFSLGLSPVLPSKNVYRETEQVLTGKTIVLTWTFPISREKLADILSQMGARVTTSVSRSTSFVLYGKTPWSKKDKAEDMGIQLYTYEEMIETYPDLGRVIAANDAGWWTMPQAVSLFT